MGNNPKKIIIVCHHYPPHITGVGVIAHNQAKNLVNLGNDVTVITSETSDNEKSSVIDGVKVNRIKANNWLEKIHAPFPIFSPKIISELYKNIKRADIVHIHDVFYMSSFFAFIVSKILNKPIIITQHISIVDHPSLFILFIQRIVYKTTGRLMFNNSQLVMTYNSRVNDFIISLGVDKDKIINFQNGVDTDFYKVVDIESKKKLKTKWGLDLDKKTILFVGRFVPKKGFEKVLDAQDDKYQIVFAGGETVLKDTSGVKFLGKLNKVEIQEIYSASDIFVLPSNSEGFPVSIQEAMASGLPVITSYDYGYDSYNLDKDNFIMLDNPNSKIIKETIFKIISNENKLNEMSVYSREYTEKNFSWCSIIKNLDSIYNKIIEEYNKIKIAFVSDAIYEFNKGGKEKRLNDIVKKLSELNYDITVYCMKWWDEKSNLIVVDKIKYVAISPYIPLYKNNRRSIKQGIIFSIYGLKLLFKKFDYIDVDHIPHLVILTSKLVSLFKRKKLIVTWHEVWGRNYWKSYLGTFWGEIAYIIEYITSKMPDEIISVSSYTTKQLKDVLGVKTVIHTIPNGLELDYLKKIEPTTELSDVIFAGRLLPNKNIDKLIQAISISKKGGKIIKTSIVGEGPELNKLKKLTSDLKLENEITFYGFLSNHSDLYSLIKSSKVFVLPSDREGFGIVVIESNACGIPVITVNCKDNAARFLVEDGKNGYVCMLEPNELSKTINNVLNNPVDKNKCVEFSSKYDWKNIVPMYKNIYK